MRRRERGGDDGVVNGEDEREADLDVVPRGAALDGGGGVDEHPGDGDPEGDGVVLPGEREGEEKEGVLEAEVGAEATGGDGGRERGAGEDVEAEDREVGQRLPRVPPLPPARVVAAGSGDGGGGHGVAVGSHCGPKSLRGLCGAQPNPSRSWTVYSDV